ncbi:VOC family protein [Chitinophaga sp. Cy-1792]|uniref:VOC family protein n=1 Tax=Chitinophaga sp. Cy-1792 TaxID=2608339 RepID=UPI00141EB6A5|nr:VOC family protein [Chitinophaga sp. Cy-1792]NIG51903.1 VOC family protein [Chitinophaga sp. Cy-1792]
MATLEPYLSFNGNCADAMSFYKSALGGQLMIMLVKDSPAKDQIPEEYHNQVMHAILKGSGFNLMASDNMSADKTVTGTNVSLTFNLEDIEDAETIFKSLSNGGKVTMPLAETFWAKRFGMLVDKYGFNWMINVTKPM